MYRYERLHQKYLHDAEKLLRKKDYPQMSEKLWGATATLVKAIATKRNWKHHSHRDLMVAGTRIATELKDPEVARLFAVAESLHANFYEDFMSPERARWHSADVKVLIEKLRPLNGSK